MKKLLFTFISLVTFIPQIHSISLAEYIQQNGMPLMDDVYGILNLSDKNLTDLTGLHTIPNINQVRYLILSDNQLQTLPANIFNGLNSLIQLILANNQLQTLPANIFNSLQSLQYLYLDSNQLQTLPDNVFRDLNNLETISLNNNQLQTLPANTFNGLRSLKYLYLNNNQLQTLLDTIFNDLNKLQDLNLSGNPFTPDFIPTLNNMIRDIPNLLTLNGKPKDLALKEQPFVTLKTTMAETIAKNLDAYRSKLHTLPSDVLDLLPLTPQERAEIEKRRAAQ